MSANYFSIKQPAFKKAEVDLWKYLGPNELDTLLGCFEIDDYQSQSEFLKNSNINIKVNKLDKYALFSRLISTQMGLNLSNKRDMILVDKYFYLVKFGVSNGFKKEQISALISISKRTHELGVETSFGNLDQTFDYFKNLLLSYSVHRPPFSIAIFSPKQIELIIHFILNSYFKQFKFYKYVFSASISLDLKFKYTNQDQESLVEQVGQTGTEMSDFGVDESLVDQNETTRVDSRMTDGSNNQQLAENQKKRDELKEFIKVYLNQHLGKMKDELLSDELFKNNQSSRPKSKSSNGAKTPNKKK